MSLIKTVDLCRVYKSGRNEVTALSDVNLSIEKGEFVGIVGVSGSGKSTLMNILGLLDLQDSGEYFLEGKSIATLSDKSISEIRNRKIGFIFQSFNLLPDLSLLENVALPLKYRKTPHKERIALAQTALSAVGLSARTDHKPFELSGGQQQRGAIARAIASDPEIILADEPCGNLDSKAGAEIMKLLTKLNTDGKTVILITHDMNAAKQADRIIEVKDGRVIA